MKKLKRKIETIAMLGVLSGAAFLSIAACEKKLALGEVADPECTSANIGVQCIRYVYVDGAGGGVTVECGSSGTTLKKCVTKQTGSPPTNVTVHAYKWTYKWSDITRTTRAVCTSDGAGGASCNASTADATSEDLGTKDVKETQDC